MRNKIIFATVLFLAILFFVILILSFSPKSKNLPSDSEFPTPYPTTSENTDDKEELTLSTIQPAENTQEEYFPVQQVGITFNHAVNPEYFDVVVSPNVQIKTFVRPEDPNTLIVSPSPAWTPGITTITISLRAISNIPYFLRGSFTYHLNSNYPKNGPPD